MNIDGKTQLLGVIGNPVEHTFSPFIHNLLADQLGINMVYVPLPIAPKDFNGAIESLRCVGFVGGNITVPYKVDIMKQLDYIDGQAELIQAVNTWKIKAGKTYGYNTDAPGLLKACEQSGVVLKNRHVLIIGAGGAAQSVALICAKEGASKITLVNRTLEKAEAIKTLINKIYKIPCQVISYGQITKEDHYEIAFQTTSIGMAPDYEGTPILDPILLAELDFAIDIVYNPIETRFLKDMKMLNVKVLNGLPMLYYQAIIAFEIWHELTIDQKIVDDCYGLFMDYFTNQWL